MRSLAALLTLAACGKDPVAPPGPTGPAACDAPVLDELELDPDGPDTQIHVASAPTEDGVWVAWNRPDANGLFDVFLGHLGCDGTMDVGPLQVDDSPDNEIDPALAVRGDEVLVAWQADDGAADANLSVRWRLVARDGTLRNDVQRLAAPGSAWMPDVAATDDGYELVGSWAQTVWEAFRVDISAAGAAGTPVAISGDPGSGQFEPAVEVSGSLQLYVFQQDEQIWWSEPGGPAVAYDGPAVVSGVQPSIDANWVTWSDAAGGLWLAPFAGTPVALDVGAGMHFGAAVAALSTDEVAVAWYTNDSGLKNRVSVGRFGIDGSRLDKVRVGAGDAPPYGLNLTLVRDGLLFVGWQTGANPDYRVAGQFVEI